MSYDPKPEVKIEVDKRTALERISDNLAEAQKKSKMATTFAAQMAWAAVIFRLKAAQKVELTRTRWFKQATAFFKGDPRPSYWVDGNGTWRARRLPTQEDLDAKLDPRQYHGPKMKCKAPALQGMANPSIRKASKDAYSPYHKLRDPKGECSACKRGARP